MQETGEKSKGEARVDTGGAAGRRRRRRHGAGARLMGEGWAVQGAAREGGNRGESTAKETGRKGDRREVEREGRGAGTPTSTRGGLADAMQNKSVGPRMRVRGPGTDS